MDSFVTDAAAVNFASTPELSPAERDSFVSIVERSLQVRDRSQFFLWTQGVVQTLLPHEILICGVMGDAGTGMVMHRFAVTRYFQQEHFDAVCEPRDGLVTHAISAWRRTGMPYLLGAGAVMPDGTDCSAALVRCELKNLAVHGLRDAHGNVLCLFCFARVPGALNERYAYRLELLLPSIHAAFLRMLTHGIQTVPYKPVKMRSITGRETEVLRWIKHGKSNAEIAQLLKLSPWTVKNHMQTILKKLAVGNRSHAVARAISLGILSSNE